MGSLRINVKLLCNKVLEVINNNDWPTEEGHDKENQPSEIRILVENILNEINIIQD